MQPPLGSHLSDRGRLKDELERHKPSAEQPSKTFPTVKAVAILEAMASARRPLGVTELGALLGLPKPTAHRIMRNLESEGLLQREPGSRRYVPGARMVQLGLGIVAAAMVRSPRHAILEALSKEIGETCNFGVMIGSHALYLDRVELAWPFGLRFEPGSRVPLHCTSMGKLFLSQLPAKKRTLLLRSIALYRYTENTITVLARLESELDKIRETEVSIDNQEFLAGVVCVAVPVRDRRAAGCGPGHFRAARAHVAAARLAACSIDAGDRGQVDRDPRRSCTRPERKGARVSLVTTRSPRS